MCQLLETIQLENGMLQNMEYHNCRCNQSRFELFGLSEEIQLEQFIQIPEHCTVEVFRCRVIYSEEIVNIGFLPHQPRNIKSLKIVIDDGIDYAYKFANREKLDTLLGQRGDCDEIIIVKNGLVTDSSVGNLIFFDGKKWWTPSTPLLNGTQRMKLLHQGQIAEKEIRMEEIRNFQKIGMINALYDLMNMPVISTGYCFF
jgi:4-amino-4-deoxychorismate lyase